MSIALEECDERSTRAECDPEPKKCLLAKELILALRVNGNCWTAICQRENEWNDDSRLCFMRDDLISRLQHRYKKCKKKICKPRGKPTKKIKRTF